MKAKGGLLRLLIYAFILVLFLSGCKDKKAVETAAKEIECEELVNDKNWDEAIETCSEIGTDKGWRLTAHSYMGKSGLSFLELMETLDSDSGDKTALIFNKVPDNSTDANYIYYSNALNAFMKKMEIRNDADWLNIMLVSTLSIFQAMKTEAGLEVSGGNIVTCYDKSSGCSFAPDTTDDSGVLKVTVSGFSPSFYTQICGSSSVTEPAATSDISGDAYTVDLTVQECTIATDSLLKYNKSASEALAANGVDLGDFSKFNLYERMDNAKDETVDVSGDDIQFNLCADATVDAAIDGKIADCEMNYYLKKSDF